MTHDGKTRAENDLRPGHLPAAHEHRQSHSLTSVVMVGPKMTIPTGFTCGNLLGSTILPPTNGSPGRYRPEWAPERCARYSLSSRAGMRPVKLSGEFRLFDAVAADHGQT